MRFVASAAAANAVSVAERLLDNSLIRSTRPRIARRKATSYKDSERAAYFRSSGSAVLAGSVALPREPPSAPLTPQNAVASAE